MIVGLVRQYLSDRALIQARHGDTTRINGIQKAPGLINRRDVAVGQFVELEVDGRSFTDGKILGGSDEATVATDPAR